MFHVDRDVEEDLVQNVDVEVVVDEVREVDLLLQMSKTMSKRTMKLAKSMSRSKVVARCCRLEDEDLVEEDDVEGSWQKDGDDVVVAWWLSLLVCRGASGVTMALLPC